MSEATTTAAEPLTVALVHGAATKARNVVGLVYVAAFAPEEGSPWPRSKPPRWTAS